MSSMYPEGTDALPDEETKVMPAVYDGPETPHEAREKQYGCQRGSGPVPADGSVRQEQALPAASIPGSKYLTPRAIRHAQEAEQRRQERDDWMDLWSEYTVAAERLAGIMHARQADDEAYRAAIDFAAVVHRIRKEST